jgi:hypothetical protein
LATSGQESAVVSGVNAANRILAAQSDLATSAVSPRTHTVNRAKRHARKNRAVNHLCTMAHISKQLCYR